MADARGGVNAQLQRRAIRHAVYWQRLRAQQVKDAVGFLNGEVIGPVRRRLEERFAAIEAAGHDRGPVTTARLQNLEFALRDLIADGMARGEERLTENLLAVGNYEAEWQAATMRGIVPIEWDFVVPAPRQILAAIESRPFQGRVLGTWWKGVTSDVQHHLSRELRAGFVEGQTTPQIVSRIIGDEQQRGALGLARHQVESITRTATTHIATEARNATYEENDDIVDGWVFVATLDSRTSLRCSVEDGKVYKLGEGQQPPLHFNAVAEGTLILTDRGEVPIERVTLADRVWTHAGRWRGVYATMHKRGPGRIIRLQTAAGAVLRVTDEHPVLTLGRGWQRADELRAGDQVFQYAEEFPEGCDARSARVEQRIVIDAHHRPSQVDEAPVAYDVLFDPARVPASVELESDSRSAEREVDHVAVDGVLEDEADARSSEGRDHFGLGSGRRRSVHRRDRARLLAQRTGILRRVVAQHATRVKRSETSRGLWLPRAPMTSAGRCDPSLHEEIDRRAPRTNRDAVSLAPSVQARRTQTERLFNGTNRLLSGDVAVLDQALDGALVGQVQHGWLSSSIVSIEGDVYECEVWNIAVEDDETYVADSVLVHNCRSTTTPVLKSWKELGIPLAELPPGTRASMNGQVPEKTTYSEWLRDQSKEVQVDALGAKRAAAFRAGEPLTKFISRDGLPLTIEELRAADVVR